MARKSHLPKRETLVTSVTSDWVPTHSFQVLETGTLGSAGRDPLSFSEPSADLFVFWEALRYEFTGLKHADVTKVCTRLQLR